MEWNRNAQATLTKLFLSLLFFCISLIFFKTLSILNKDLALFHVLTAVFFIKNRVVVFLWLRDTRPNSLRITCKLLLMQHEIYWHQIRIKKWSLTIVMVSDIKIQLSDYFFIEEVKGNRIINSRICSKPTWGEKRKTMTTSSRNNLYLLI